MADPNEQSDTPPPERSISPRPPLAERLWTSREVCEYLGVGKNAPSELVHRGELPGMRIGRRLRFDPAAVRAFAQRHQTGAAPVVPLAGRRGA